MMKEKIGVGIIGAGGISSSHTIGYKESDDLARITAIADTNLENAEKLIKRHKLEDVKVFEDYRELLDYKGVDAVSICTPHYLHSPIAIEAAERGKHILCEKSMATSLADARKMYKYAKKAKVVAMINFTYQYIPAVQMIHKLISGGYLGEIYRLRAEYIWGFLFARMTKTDGWLIDRKRSGSGIAESLGSHIIHLGRYLVGDIKRLSGQSKQLIPAGDVDDSTMFIAEFENGAVGSFEASAVATGRMNYQRVEINASLGGVIYEFDKPSELQISTAEGELAKMLGGFNTIRVPGPFCPDQSSGHRYATNQMVRVFLEGIADGKLASPDFYDGLKSQEIIEAALLSSKEGRWIDIEELEEKEKVIKV